MRYKKTAETALSVTLGLMLGLGAVGCLVSAYDFSVSLWAVGIFCLLAVTCRSLPKGQYLAGFGLALAAVWLLLDGSLLTSLEALVFRLSKVYDLGYGWGVVRWSDLAPEELDKALPVVCYLLGSWIALLTAGAVKGNCAVLPILLTMLPLGACFVVTDKVPATAWVFLVLFAVTMLLLGALLGKQNREQAIRLRLTAFVPVFLCVLLLFAFVPKNGYNGAARAERWTEAIVDLWERILGRADELLDSNSVDLTDVGRQSYFESEVMQVTAQVDGRLYLRSRALDTYDGKSWTNSGTDLKLPWPEESELERIGEVEIRTQYVHRMMYLPYYTQSLDMNQYATGKVNEHKLKTYSVSAARLSGEETLLVYYPNAYCQLHVLGMDASEFTDLPDDTKRWARQKVEEITGGKISWYHIAKDIEAYVEESATYNLKTDRMPLGKKDFARWFLEEGDTGYCVHFATAAAVLLRAAGIPARYVTGYMVDAKAGEAVTVTDADAHAWVEYWLPPFGWVVLEATPASVSPSVEPTETRPATEPTQTHVEKDETLAPEVPAEEVSSVLWWVLGAAGFVFLVWLRRKLRLARRMGRLRQKEPNAIALQYWQQLEACYQALGETPDEAALALAEKAKFSQYTITNEELTALEEALEQVTLALKRKNIFLQAYYTFILVLY